MSLCASKQKVVIGQIVHRSRASASLFPKLQKYPGIWGFGRQGQTAAVRATQHGEGVRSWSRGHAGQGRG